MSFLEGFEKARQGKKLTPEELRKQRALTAGATTAMMGGGIYGTAHLIKEKYHDLGALREAQKAVEHAKNSPAGLGTSLMNSQYQWAKSRAREHMLKAISSNKKKKIGIATQIAGVAGLATLGALRNKHTHSNIEKAKKKAEELK